MKPNLILSLKSLILSIIFACTFSGIILAASDKDTVYVIEVKQNIDKSSVRKLNLGLKEAERLGADYVVIHMDTYGGAVDAADSMRKEILRYPVPVVSFIDMQAASAGALISIACDSIYMRTGASIGAATVVNQNGEVMPDKYQSFMRGMMRATAESHGKRTVVDEDGTVREEWVRDPEIAAQMVDTANVLSFTPSEAIEAGYCEGMAETVEEVADKLCQGDYEIVQQELTWMEKFILFMISPLVQGILVMMIVGGIYFELQSPGLGLPSVIALLGAVLYFSPLYIYGLAMHWEIVLFVIGLILIAVEIFVTPGFGVAGILGILLTLTSLIFAMVDNDILYFKGTLNLKPLVKPIAIVLTSVFAGMVLAIWGASKLYPKKSFSYIAQKTEMKVSDGWVGVSDVHFLVGKQVVAATAMSPSGKVEYEGKQYEAIMEFGSANSGDLLQVIRVEGGRLYCILPENQSR